MGICGLLFFLLIVLGPLILFSSLNPTFELNPVKGMGAEIGLVINNSNYFKLYGVSRVSSIDEITDSEWKAIHTAHLREINNNDREMT